MPRTFIRRSSQAEVDEEKTGWPPAAVTVGEQGKVQRLHWHADALLGKYADGIEHRSLVGFAPDTTVPTEEWMPDGIISLPGEFRGYYERSNLVGSLTASGLHAPALDIDYPAHVLDSMDGLELQPPNGLTGGKKAYSPLIVALAEAGIIGEEVTGHHLVYAASASPLWQPQSLCLQSLACPAALVPSATTDHYHLFLDVELDWSVYARLLKRLAKTGLIEQGFAKASIRRGMSHLRYPADSKNFEIS